MEAEQIIQERKSRGKKEYLVRWKGKGPAADSWEPASSIPQKVVKRFSSPKKSRSRSASRGRGRAARSRSKGRTPSKSPSRRRSAPTARQSRRSVIETKSDVSDVKTEVTSSKTETTSQNDIGTVTRTVVEEKVVTLKKAQLRPQEPAQKIEWGKCLPDMRRIYNPDYAMIILFTCVTILTLSFILENKVDWAMIWNYLKELFNSIVTMMSSVLPSSSDSKSSGTTGNRK